MYGGNSQTTNFSVYFKTSDPTLSIVQTVNPGKGDCGRQIIYINKLCKLQVSTSEKFLEDLASQLIMNQNEKQHVGISMSVQQGQIFQKVALLEM